MGAGAAKRIEKLLWNRQTTRRLKVKMLMVFVYPTVTYGCETWAMGRKEKQQLDVWWMKLLRRVAGVTRWDRVKSDAILQRLRASRLSKLVEERQLRYCGHVQRYPDDRWVKFAVSATTPGETKTGRAKQYCKTISKLLKDHNLTTEMMKDADNKGVGWRRKLAEIFPKSSHTTPLPLENQAV